MSERTQLVADEPIQGDSSSTAPQQADTSSYDWTWLYILIGALAILLLFAALVAALVMYRRASSGENVPLLSRWLSGQQKKEAEEEGVSLESENLDEL